MMLYSFILAINLVLTLLGLYFLFHTIIFSILMKGEKDHRIVVAGYEDDDDLFDKIYRAHLQINMHCYSQSKPVYVIDCGLSHVSKTRLLSYFSAIGQIIFVSQDNIAHVLCERKD